MKTNAWLADASLRRSKESCFLIYRNFENDILTRKLGYVQYDVAVIQTEQIWLKSNG